MRLFVSFGRDMYPIDTLSVDKTVGEIKKLLRGKFSLSFNNKRGDNEMDLTYQGTSLKDEWIYSDLGIPPGSILACRLGKSTKSTLTVFCSSYDEAIEFKEPFPVTQTQVSELRVKIQDATGIHVSAFQLYTLRGVELFDCHPLKVYGVDKGDTITMVIWRDISELVKAARANDITDTVQSLASFHENPVLMRYQLQLGLFVAAHYGYHQLATQLIKCGARPSEPIGLHPSRDWCRDAGHPGNVKTPAHEAAQHGRITCLQHFLMFNHSILICKDANGLTPCNIARRYKQTECFKLLVAEQFRLPTVCGLSIHVYSRVRKWCDHARARARIPKDKTTLLLRSNAVTHTGAMVGQKVSVDGYSGKIDERSNSLKNHDHVKTNKGRIGSRLKPSSSPFADTSGSLRLRNGKIISENSGRFKSPTQLGTKSVDSPSASSRSNLEECCRQQTLQNYNRVNETARDPNLKPRMQPGNVKFEKEHDSACKDLTQPVDSTHRPNSDMIRLSTGKRNHHQVKQTTTQDMGSATQRGTTRGKSGTQPQSVASSRESRLSTANLGQRNTTPQSASNSGRYMWKSLDESEYLPDTKQVTIQVGSEERPNSESSLSTTRGEQEGNDMHTNRNTSRYVRSLSCAFESRPDELRRTLNERSKRDRSRSLPFIRSPGALVVDEEQESSVRYGYNEEQSGKEQGYHHSNMPVTTAEHCLRLASETFPKKSWLGQLQMALVVNTNICKRR